MTNLNFFNLKNMYLKTYLCDATEDKNAPDSMKLSGEDFLDGWQAWSLSY